jgi:Flp pilus assembly protein TadG
MCDGAPTAACLFFTAWFSTMMRTRKAGRRPAAATVEFAVLLPFLLFLAVIATDWARLLYYTITIEACARNGAMYASDAEVAYKSPYPNVQTAALAEAPSLKTGATTSTTTTSGATKTTTYYNASGAWCAKVSTTSTTDSTGHAAVICTVEVPFQTFSNFPGVPKAQTLTRTCTMRMAELLITTPPTAVTNPIP